jgi:hypothetical protein
MLALSNQQQRAFEFERFWSARSIANGYSCLEPVALKALIDRGYRSASIEYSVTERPTPGIELAIILSCADYHLIVIRLRSRAIPPRCWIRRCCNRWATSSPISTWEREIGVRRIKKDFDGRKGGALHDAALAAAAFVSNEFEEWKKGAIKRAGANRKKVEKALRRKNSLGQPDPTNHPYNAEDWTSPSAAKSE